MSPTALVVGGTGPTGVSIVNSLLERGYAVTIFHSGRHPAEFAGPVAVREGDPREGEEIARCLAGDEWDLTICTSGRLRLLARALAGRTGRFVGITGQPVYAGTMMPTPSGTPVLPLDEKSERQSTAPGYFGKIREGEDEIFERHANGDFEGVIVRYPGLYGERSYLAHEWAVVRRVLDGRPTMILPHDGCTYFQRGYVENVARLVVLAATHPAAPGHAFNAGDTQVMSARHVAEVICDELGSDMTLLGVPAEWCRGTFPLAEKSSLILSMALATSLLGYVDALDVVTATRRTARYLRDHPIDDREVNAMIVGRFDYEREDHIIRSWESASAQWSATAG